MFKLIKTLLAYIKWRMSSEHTLLTNCVRLRNEAVTGKFHKFNKYCGICNNVISDNVSGNAIRYLQQIMACFVEEYPHPEGTHVDKNWLAHAYPVEGNAKDHQKSMFAGTSWDNPRRLQLLDYIINELESGKP